MEMTEKELITLYRLLGHHDCSIESPLAGLFDKLSRVLGVDPLGDAPDFDKPLNLSKPRINCYGDRLTFCINPD